MRNRISDPNALVLTEDELKKELLRYKDLFWDMMDKSKKLGVEHGFTLCWDNEKKTSYLNGSVCKGERCGVLMPRCQWPGLCEGANSRNLSKSSTDLANSPSLK